MTSRGAMCRGGTSQSRARAWEFMITQAHSRGLVEVPPTGHRSPVGRAHRKDVRMRSLEIHTVLAHAAPLISSGATPHE